MLTISLDPHPLLDVACFLTEFPQSLGSMPSPESVARLWSAEATAPWQSSDAIREAIRALLRWGGFKPTGRSKPASEYLLKAIRENLYQSINLAVDACNVVSLHSGLPISVVDLDRASPPFKIAIAAFGSSYVFNTSGQTIDLGGLLCLCDAEGPCANAVKDAQRTKTTPETRRTLSVVWSTQALGGRAAGVAAWYRTLLESAGATTRDVACS
ncbi:MAG: hypothetical protein RIS70_4095 [Planctomycetota bacterium]